MAYSFSTSGATPAPNIPGLPYNPYPTTSTSKALNIYGNGSPSNFAIPSTIGGTTTPATPKPANVLDFSKIAVTSGLLPTSQTHTAADGSSVTTKYQSSGASTGNAGSASIGSAPAGSSSNSYSGDGSWSSGGNPQGSPQTNPTSEQGILGSLVNTATTPNPLLTQDIARQQELASELGPALSTVTNTPGLLANQNARASNITQAYGQEMQGLGANISALENLQGTQQQGLIGAGGLAKPETAAFGQTVFNPATGQYEGGGGLPAEVMQQYAQMAANGQYSAIPSTITSNPVLSAQLNAAAKKLNPNFNPITSTAQGGVLSSLPALQSANTAAKGIEQTITSFLQGNPQLNASSLAVANAAQQWIQGKQLTDPNYQTLFNYLSEYTNTLAPILGVGGDPTNLKTQIAQGFINAQASGQSIAQVLQSIGQLADQKIQNLQSGATGGGVVSGGSSGSLYDF